MSTENPESWLSHELALSAALVFLHDPANEWLTNATGTGRTDIFRIWRKLFVFRRSRRTSSEAELFGIRASEEESRTADSLPAAVRDANQDRSYRRSPAGPFSGSRRGARGRATLKRETEQFRGRRPTFFQDDCRSRSRENGLRIRLSSRRHCRSNTRLSPESLISPRPTTLTNRRRLRSNSDWRSRAD